MAIPGSGHERVAIVVVTFNRAELLRGMLQGLAEQTRPADEIVIIDNASSDHTRAVLAEFPDLPIRALHLDENTGGAGGFHTGLQTAYDAGFDRMWLMDDDVVPAPDCLEVLLRHDQPALIAVREDLRGSLVEKAATRFDLKTPWLPKPKRASVESTYGSRAAMPELAEVENVAFEGFLVHRRVVEAVGLPDASFFIFYDDAEDAVRARQAGFRIFAVRDAVLVRQLDFDQQHALDTWKGYYMYRNLFVVHFRHGENAFVRAKPYLLTAGVVALSPLRGGRAEASNVIRALRAARPMRAYTEGSRPRR